LYQVPRHFDNHVDHLNLLNQLTLDDCRINHMISFDNLNMLGKISDVITR